MNENNKLILFAILAIVVIYLLKDAIGDLAETLGLKKSESEQKEEKVIKELSLSAFNANFFQTNAAVKAKCDLFTVASANDICKNLYDSTGLLNDNEDKMLANIKKCKTKSQLSFIAYRFNILYKKDLFSFLKDYFEGDEEFTEALNYVDQLPNYNKK